MSPVLDRFIQIIEENDLNPEDIEKVEYTPCAVITNRMWVENELRTEEDHGFHGPYLVSCAAHRIKPIDYVSKEVQRNPKIRDFMDKVKVLEMDPDFGKAILQDPAHYIRFMHIIVYAKGKVFRMTNRVVDWSWSSEGKATDEDLANKFREVVTGFLPSNKTEKAIKSLLNLENIGDINELTELLVP
jgi:2-methylcitrate dehydratase PrpD